MKYQFDYTISIAVKDQYGMDVYSIDTNPEDLNIIIQEMEDAILQYDKDLGYVANDQLPILKDEEKDDEEEEEKPISSFITPVKKSTFYERKSIKAKAQ